LIGYFVLGKRSSDVITNHFELDGRLEWLPRILSMPERTTTIIVSSATSAKPPDLGSGIRLRREEFLFCGARNSDTS
jgi:hypothetical protein